VWAFLARYQLTRAPGTEYLYSNLSANALGLALERAHGLSLEQLFTQVITGPLGMSDTAIELSKAQHARLALGYGSGGQRATEYTAGYPLVGGAGGLRSTLRDMMRYLEFELGELDSPLNSLLPVLHKARYATGPSVGGGLAWNMAMLGDGTSIISKGGQEPGYSSSIVFTPATHAGAVVLANQKSCGAPKIGTALIHRINGLTTGR
jgi:CubicO group peptidase (beta-lactamase class C family)